MGFYDNEVKRVCQNNSRLLILAINSIFGKNHDETKGVIYLNREQNEIDENPDFMDMLVQIESDRYHIEFQLLEDNMDIRMYEYAAKESIQALHSNTSTREEKYKITIEMPRQAVVFLTGNNTEDKISVELKLPDGQICFYNIPFLHSKDFPKLRSYLD